MVNITLKIEEEDSNYSFVIEASSGCFKNVVCFSLSEEDFETFVNYLNSSEKNTMHGDVSNGHEEIDFCGPLVTVSSASYLGNFSPCNDLTLAKDYYKSKIEEFKNSRLPLSE